MAKSFAHLALAALLISTLLTACSEQKLDYVPSQGEMSYDINYSSDIKDLLGLSSKFLPRKMDGVYSPDGIKLSISGGLGLLHIDIVGTPSDSYVTIDINGDKMLLPFAQLFPADSIAAHNGIHVEYSDTTENICGWDSYSLSALCPSPDGDINIKIYYVAMENKTSQKIADLPVDDIPGLVTAMSITKDYNNVTFMLNDIHKADNIKPSTFNRPADFRLTNLSEVDSLIKSNIKQ